MDVKVKMYAALKDYFQETLEINLSQGATISDIKKSLTEIKPASHALLEKCRFAINQEFAACEARLNAGDVIDILPPSSGG